MHEFNLPDMSCGHCVRAVTQAAQDVDPDAKVQVDLERRRAQVESAEPRERFVEALKEAGYTPA